MDEMSRFTRDPRKVSLIAYQATKHGIPAILIAEGARDERSLLAVCSRRPELTDVIFDAVFAVHEGMNERRAA